MTRLSIVIPVVGRNAAFEAGLVSVLSERPANVEVIAVLNGPYEDPYDLADEVRFLQAPRSANWATSVNRGIIAASGEFVHVLDAGAQVSGGWTDQALELLTDPAVSGVASNVLAANGRTVLAGQIHQRGTLATITPERLKRRKGRQPLAPLVTSGFYRQDDVLTLCGLEENQPPEFAVADLAIRLCQAGGRIESAAGPALISAGAPLSLSSFRRGQGEERFHLFQLEESSLSTIAGRALRGMPGVLFGKYGPLSGLACFAGRVQAWMAAGEIRQERRLRDGLTMELAAEIEERLLEAAAPVATHKRRAA